MEEVRPIQIVKTWKFWPFNFFSTALYCDERTLTLNDSAMYAECLDNIRDIEVSAGARKTYLTVFAGLSAFFIVFIGI